MEELIDLIQFTNIYIILLGYMMAVVSMIFFTVWVIRNVVSLFKGISGSKHPVSPKDDEFGSLPKCSCNDVTQCDTWCRAKARFTRDHQ